MQLTENYEPLIDEIKDLIHKKQYEVLKQLNAETINLYWHSCLRNCKKNFPEQKDIPLPTYGE